MQILRRLGWVEQSQKVRANIQKLRQRQNQQLSLIGQLNLIDNSLLDMTLEQLSKINNPKVFNTFVTRCLLPEVKALNGLADMSIERVFQKQGQSKIPFSVKDHLQVDGLIQTCGFSNNLTPSQNCSDVVQLLQREGCIAFTHSNVPQGLLGIKSANSVYGVASNPFNSKFLSGGSSGGQGSLVASRACAFGVGSDSGGSVRIPAAWSGTYGFKPTGSKRLSVKGRVGPSGIEGIKIGDVDTSLGFLTRNFDDLPWLCQRTIGKTITPYSPFLYGGEWDTSKFQASKRKKLRVGYLYTNHEMRVAPGIVNSIQQTLQALKAKKHTVVQFNFPKLHQFRDFFFKYIYLSGFLQGMFNRIEGHTFSNEAAQFYDMHRFGKWAAWLKHKKSSCPVQQKLYNLFDKKPSKKQFFGIHMELEQLRKEFLKEWYEKDIDVLITPVMPFTALLPDATDLLVYQLSYCCFQNILEMPSGAIPTRLVKEEETHYKPVTAFEQKAALSIWQSEGLPLSIQVTGRHMEDEECMGAMWQIKRLVGGTLTPPLHPKTD